MEHLKAQLTEQLYQFVKSEEDWEDEATRAGEKRIRDLVWHQSRWPRRGNQATGEMLGTDARADEDNDEEDDPENYERRQLVTLAAISFGLICFTAQWLFWDGYVTNACER